MAERPKGKPMPETGTGTKPASRDNPLVNSVIAACDPCQCVWVCGNFLSSQHAYLAVCLPWLCPDCFRPLTLKATMPKYDQPAGDPC